MNHSTSCVFHRSNRIVGQRTYQTSLIQLITTNFSAMRDRILVTEMDQHDRLWLNHLWYRNYTGSLLGHISFKEKYLIPSIALFKSTTMHFLSIKQFSTFQYSSYHFIPTNQCLIKAPRNLKYTILDGKEMQQLVVCNT